MWAAPAVEVAASYHRIAAAHPGRFLLGVGIGHPEATQEYRSPYDTIVDYLDVLDAEGVPVEDRALAALGPKVLALAAERTAGAHPYLTTPDHTRLAREILGDGPAARAGAEGRARHRPGRRPRAGPARRSTAPTCTCATTREPQRLGWTDADLADGGSDALIDALAVHGDAATVAPGSPRTSTPVRTTSAIQLLTPPDADPLPGLRALAERPRAVAVIDPARASTGCAAGAVDAPQWWLRSTAAVAASARRAAARRARPPHQQERHRARPPASRPAEISIAVRKPASNAAGSV